MAIIVEDGSIVSGANSYVSEAELTAYATARGLTLTSGAEQLLISAMDWVEVQSFKGTKSTSGQPLQWPRESVYIDGYLIASDEIPQDLKLLQMRLAADIDAGSDPNGVSSQNVKQETVFGAVSVTYQDGSGVSNVSKQTTALLSKLTVGGGGVNQFSVMRG